MSNAIEIHQLHYRAGRTFEIKELNLNVPLGSIYGFLGPNGSGKTTMIRLMLGLLRPLSGRITVLGDDVPRDAARVLARVGFVPEQPHLDPILTVRETLACQAAFYPTWDRLWAERLLRQFELEEGQPFGRLSKGQKGKLVMLLALAQRPELLVLDEPTDGLDPVVRRDVLSALLDYVAQCQATVCISSHLVHELERFCDWIGVMDNGRVITEVPMERFKNGIKRLRISDAPPTPDSPPFVLLAREPASGGGVRRTPPHVPRPAQLGARHVSCDPVQPMEVVPSDRGSGHDRGIRPAGRVSAGGSTSRPESARGRSAVECGAEVGRALPGPRGRARAARRHHDLGA